MSEREKSTRILFYLLAFTIAMFALSVLALLYVYAHPTITLKWIAIAPIKRWPWLNCVIVI